MNYELICVDIDGTLLNDEKKLLPQVREKLRAAAAKGSRIALVSGRMPAGVNSIEKELGIPCVKVCNAGTYIIVGEQCICTEYMMPKVMRDIYLEIARKNNLPLWIFQEQKWFVSEIDRFIKREIEIIRYQPEVVDVEALADKWEEEGTGPNKLLLAAEPEKIQEIYDRLKEENWPEIDIARSADTFLEIFPKGMSKGRALLTICERLDVDIKNTIAFGDHELDIPLIEAAGTGVAMGNAIEELKAKADFVTKTNNEAGVAYALEYYLE